MDINGIQNATQLAKMQQQYTSIQKKQKTAGQEEVKDNKNTAKEPVNQANDIPKDNIDTRKKNYKMDTEKIAALKAQFSQQSSSFQAMITKMFENQGITSFQATNNLADLFNQVVVDAETQKKAAETISEDGYFGVKKTAARIIDFAKALAGDDPSKIETLKSAFERGFEAAKARFGGTLPDISYQTREAVMKGFDEWATPTETKTESTEKAQ